MNRREFHCRCCGACCRIKDGIVRVSDAEISRIAAYLGMNEAEFIANETERAPAGLFCFIKVNIFAESTLRGGGKKSIIHFDEQKRDRKSDRRAA